MTGDQEMGEVGIQCGPETKEMGQGQNGFEGWRFRLPAV